MFLVQVTKNQLELQQVEPMTSGSANVYVVRFEFSKEWEGLNKTAVFRATGIGIDSPITVSVLLDDSNECMVPWEVLTVPGSTVLFGAYGLLGNNVVLPTVWLSQGVVLEGVITTEGVGAGEPNPDLYQQLLDRINKAESFDPANYYTKPEIDSKFVTKSGLSTTHYTKAEVDAIVSDIVDEGGVSVDLSDYYTKGEVDNLLAGVGGGGEGSGGTVNLSNYYTKQETYSKTEVDALIAGVSIEGGGSGSGGADSDAVNALIKAYVDTNIRAITTSELEAILV